MTATRMPPSIVSSNMMIRFVHHATIGMLPVGSGHARWVMRASHTATASPVTPPATAIQNIHVADDDRKDKGPFTHASPVYGTPSYATAASPPHTAVSPIFRPVSKQHDCHESHDFDIEAVPAIKLALVELDVDTAYHVLRTGVDML